MRMRCAIVCFLAWGLWLAACDGGTSRPDAGTDADAATVSDGDAGADGSDAVDADAGDEERVELVLHSVLPSRGPVEGGTWVNFVGSGFVRGFAGAPWSAEDDTDVVFGDNPALDIEVIRDDMIGVRVPAGVAGPVDVTVSNPNGRATLEDAFVYYEPVTARSVEPEAFSARGGTAFRVEGGGFTEDSSVLVAGRPASAVVVTDSAGLQAVSPQAPPGPADIEVINRNGRALLFRAVTIHALPDIDALFPPAGPEEGGTRVVAQGAGFDESVQLLFGGTPAVSPSYPAPDRMIADTPPGSGVVDVIAAGPIDSTTLPGGFVYVTDPTGIFRLITVSPAAGPAAGGQTVVVVGDGLDTGVVEVLFGTQPGTSFFAADSQMLAVTTPAGQPGPCSVTVRRAADELTLEDGFRYYQALQVESIEPGTGPVSGGTAFSLSGSGFHAEMEILIGGLAAEQVEILSDTAATGVTPPGAPGQADVIAVDADSSGTLPGGFVYTAGLSLVRVHPDVGAMAGGTLVTCYGAGFEPGVQLWFGDREAAEVEVLSPAVLSARTPRGNPGEVDVRIELAAESVVLPAGFAYFDPTCDMGGASGGPVQGSFNVTALDGQTDNFGAPIPEATVIIEDPPLSGLTDDRGQLTLSSPDLVRAVTVTIGKEGYEAMTVADLDATNLTVYLFPNNAVPSMGNQPGCERVAILEGQVFGFKDLPGLPSGPDISLLALVNVAAKDIYALPPFAPTPGGLVVEEEGGEYSGMICFGNYALYSLFGAYDSAAETFTTALMGLRRGVEANVEGEPITGLDLVLGTYLDQTAAVHFQDPPAGTVFGAYAHMDLGQEGYIHLSQALGEGDLVLERLPAATSDSFVFVGEVSSEEGYPTSYTFRRPEGDVRDGVTLGPFLGYAELTGPEWGGALGDGPIAWSVEGPQPELIYLVLQTATMPPSTMWRMALPGDARSVALPDAIIDLLPLDVPMFLIIFTSDSPRFDFDHFSYSQLGSSYWTSYTVNYTVCTAR
ncbi:MAG: IPT/TIG domain-containing protein [Deltaproteobacteria bacterium]|nr:IPT/TIG domain-containing protein [Deltaproteobacteria bacterium]